MADIDLGIPLAAGNGDAPLDEVIRSGRPTLKPDGRTPYRLKFDGPEHILTIGPTRSGKGRRLLCPELIYDTDRSILVVDPKGELAKWTAAHRTKHGEVIAIDPFGVLEAMPGLNIVSAGFNPMQWLDPASDDFIDDATAIAEAISPVENQKEPHWEEGAQDILAGLIMYHRIVNPDAHLADIRAELSRTAKEWRDFMVGEPVELPNGDTVDMSKNRATGKRDMVAALAVAKVDCPAIEAKLGELAEISPEDRELKGFIRSAKTKTRFLDSPQIARDLAKPGIDFRILKEQTTTVYLVLPPIRLVTHAKWLRLVISGAIEALRKTERNAARPDVLMILDEFPQLGRMQSVETGVQLNAGYGIKFWVVVQNITQLQNLYEDNWETFTSSGALTSYAPRDPTTSKYLTDLAGERTIEVRGDSIGQHGDRSVSINRQRRENVMPHQFRQMSKGRMFVRLPDAKHGERLYITDALDFTQRDDIPDTVKRLG